MRPSPEFFVGADHPSPRFAGLSSIARSGPIVFIAASDAFTTEALRPIICDMGWRVKELSSADALLPELELTVPSCLVLDISRPTPGDVHIEDYLAARRAEMPVVCLIGTADVLTTVRIMKAGAVDVLPKPVRSDLLTSAIQEALAQSQARLRENMVSRTIRESYASLSPRERDVMGLIVCGLLNKQVGGELGISEITVKAHRGRVMRKMKARSFVELLKMADTLKLAARRAAN